MFNPSKTQFILGIFCLFLSFNSSGDALDNFILSQQEKNEKYSEEIFELKEKISQLEQKLYNQDVAQKLFKKGVFEQFIDKKAQKPKKTITKVNYVASNRSYRNARDLVLDGQYEKATTAFITYINDYPDGGNIAEARFWLANSYAAQNNFNEASKGYMMFTIQHKTHYKVPNALYRLAVSQYELGYKDKANRLIKSIIRRFPNHRIIPEVKKSLIKFNK